MCCCFRCSNKLALVVTRILIAILISQPSAIDGSPRQAGYRTRALVFVCAQSCWGTLLRRLWLALLPGNEPFPTDRKSAARLAAVIELENEITGDIERDWERNNWSARAIGRSRRIVLDHTG